jgi:hypothetical protein
MHCDYATHCDYLIRQVIITLSELHNCDCFSIEPYLSGLLAWPLSRRHHSQRR